MGTGRVGPGPTRNDVGRHLPPVLGARPCWGTYIGPLPPDRSKRTQNSKRHMLGVESFS